MDILPQIIPLKQCRSCPEGQQWHPATSDFFPRNKTKKDGLESRCKACHRAQTKAYALANPDKVSLRGRRYHLANPMKHRAGWRKRQYGITVEEYDLLFFRQGGVCAVCGQAETRRNSRTHAIIALSVDHNHDTGEVRELLCSICNTMLGHIEKDRERVKKLVKYIKKHDR